MFDSNFVAKSSIYRIENASSHALTVYRVDSLCLSVFILFSSAKNEWQKDEMVHNVLTAVIAMLKITPSIDIDAAAAAAKLHKHTIPFGEQLHKTEKGVLHWLNCAGGSFCHLKNGIQQQHKTDGQCKILAFKIGIAHKNLATEEPHYANNNIK